MCKNVERITYRNDSVKTFELRIMVVFPCPLNDFLSTAVPSELIVRCDVKLVGSYIDCCNIVLNEMIILLCLKIKVIELRCLGFFIMAS